MTDTNSKWSVRDDGVLVTPGGFRLANGIRLRSSIVDLSLKDYAALVELVRRQDDTQQTDVRPRHAGGGGGGGGAVSAEHPETIPSGEYVVVNSKNPHSPSVSLHIDGSPTAILTLGNGEVSGTSAFIPAPLARQIVNLLSTPRGNLDRPVEPLDRFYADRLADLLVEIER